MIHKPSSLIQVSIACFVVLFFVSPLILFGYLNIKYTNKAFPNINIANINVSNKTHQQIVETLKTNMSLQKPVLIITYQEQSWEMPLDEIGFSYNLEATAWQAINYGRNSSVLENFNTVWNLRKTSHNFTLDYQLDYQQLDTKINQIAESIDIPAILPTIELKTISTGEKQILVHQGTNGVKLNKEKLLSLITTALTSLKYSSITATIEEIESVISQEQIANISIKANNLLTKQLVLKSQDNSWVLTDQELINFLNPKDTFDQEKIASYSASIANTINRPAQNAQFNFAEGLVTEFVPAKEGLELNQEETANQIMANITSLLTLTEKSQTVNLPIIVTPPEIRTQDVNNLGIKELIGKGESWFSGSINSRIHNLTLVSKKIHGLLIPPNEIFSFNQAVGEISSQTGYQQAYIIKDGRTVLGDGGGLCQVSTTLFRASLNAGIPIEERKPHAYRVGYYEQNYQVGVDATVFSPSTDFKIKNDTQNYILIQTEVDPLKHKLTIYLYGTNDGRKITISQSRIWNQAPPPPDLYQDDPTLPKGVIKQVDWKAWGANVSFDWKVSKDDQVLQERTFYSSYRPWQSVFLKGPT